jgi:plastocyanin
MRVWSAVGLVVVTTSLLGCGGSDTGTGPSACGAAGTNNAVDVCDNSFGPSTTTVPVGTTVTWTWRGSNAHDVAFSGGPSSAVQTSGSYARQFTAAGNYDYICTVHGSAMSGRVVVQ